MTSRDFCYWLQGFFEVAHAGAPNGIFPPVTPQQADIIKRHLALVFVHEIDPSAGPPDHQTELNKIHAGKTAPVLLPQGMPSGVVYRC